MTYTTMDPCESLPMLDELTGQGGCQRIVASDSGPGLREYLAHPLHGGSLSEVVGQ